MNRFIEIVDRVLASIQNNRIYIFLVILLVPISYLTALISINDTYLKDKEIKYGSNKDSGDVKRDTSSAPLIDTFPPDTTILSKDKFDSSDTALSIRNSILSPNIPETTDESNIVFLIDSGRDLSEADNRLKTTSSVVVVPFNNAAGDRYTLSENSVIQMNEPPPEKGNGKLALRTNCSYCNSNESGISIYDDDDSYITSTAIEDYDANKKRGTTFIREFKPGKYVAKIDYGSGRIFTVPFEIFESKISLIRNLARNPFGGDKAQLVITTNNPFIKYKISIDTLFHRVIYLKKKQELRIILPSGTHNLTVESLFPNTNSLNSDIEKRIISLVPGERAYQSID